MFLIVPKPKPGHTPLNGSAASAKAAPLAPIPSSRGPIRAVTACDRCRIRKVKCNGKEPCQRCLQSSNICVYSKPRDEVGLVPGAYVSMLKSQQRRLLVALRNMDSIIEAQPRPTAENQHDSHDDFDLTRILEKYAPCSKVEAMKDASPGKAPIDQRTGPQKKRRFQHSSSLGEEAPSWPGGTVPIDALAPGFSDNRWPMDDRSYDLAGPWDQSQSPSDTLPVELKHETEMPSETWDQSPPGSGLNNPSTERQHDETGDVILNGIGPTASAPSNTLPGSELTPYNMSFEELYQLIDWDASWQSCSEHFPMPDPSRAIGLGQGSMDWEH